MDDENHLLRGMARRDPVAWDAMYRRHVGDVYGVVYHLVGGDRHLAEDVNQEVWLLALDRFDRFDPGRGGFRDWLLGIARHRALRRHRSARDLTAVGQPEGVSQTATPPEWLEGVERADAVRAALLCLPRDSRQVLLAKYAEGLSVAAIAARGGRSPKGVESLLSRARARLRALLTPYFEHPEGGPTP
jgi:RNA polymerase sigma-70 factor (ECF subfamily)